MKTYKNPISTAMSEYREDFRYNKEWWTERMGVGNNNEYLWIQFKNGDSITIQADYFQYDGNTCLPRFRAEEVAYISRYYGDQIETTTASDIVVDTDTIILYRDGVKCFRYEMTEEEVKEMRRQIWELDEDTNATAWMLDYINENNITVTADNREEIEEQLRDDLWACDSVTGNASGSYTFNAWQAEENICHNQDLFAEACDEFGSDAAELLRKGAEACDVTIRCYLLPQAISAALDEVETEEEEIEE